jgi:hypothetical protein
MKPSDWDSPEIRAIGRRWAVESYDIASELRDFGADAADLLTPHRTRRAPREICLPTMLVDVPMAILLTLPRQKGAPDQPLGENVTALKKRLA